MNKSEFELLNEFMGVVRCQRDPMAGRPKDQIPEPDYQNNLDDLFKVVDRIHELLPGLIANNETANAKIVRRWSTMSIFTPRTKIYTYAKLFALWYLKRQPIIEVTTVEEMDPQGPIHIFFAWPTFPIEKPSHIL